MSSELGLEYAFLAGAYAGEKQFGHPHVVLRDAQRCIADDQAKSERVREWHDQVSTGWAPRDEMVATTTPAVDIEAQTREAFTAMDGTADFLPVMFVYWIIDGYRLRSASRMRYSDPAAEQSEFIVHLPFPERNNPLVFLREIDGSGACELSVLDKYRNEWVPIETGNTPFERLEQAAHDLWREYCIYHPFLN